MGGWHLHVAGPKRQKTDKHMALNNGYMDRWISGGEKDEVFVRDAETNGSVYP